MNYGNGDQRMVRLAELWERTSARGTRYFSGFLGDAQVLMFDGGEREHPTRPGETVHVWRLMVQERDPARRPQARSEQRPQSPDPGDGRVSTSATPAKPSARPQESDVRLRDLEQREVVHPERQSPRSTGRGDGWRGSQYRRPANGARRPP